MEARWQSPIVLAYRDKEPLTAKPTTKMPEGPSNDLSSSNPESKVEEETEIVAGGGYPSGLPLFDADFVNIFISYPWASMSIKFWADCAEAAGYKDSDADDAADALIRRIDEFDADDFRRHVRNGKHIDLVFKAQKAPNLSRELEIVLQASSTQGDRLKNQSRHAASSHSHTDSRIEKIHAAMSLFARELDLIREAQKGSCYVYDAPQEDKDELNKSLDHLYNMIFNSHHKDLQQVLIDLGLTTFAFQYSLHRTGKLGFIPLAIRFDPADLGNYSDDSLDSMKGVEMQYEPYFVWLSTHGAAAISLNAASALKPVTKGAGSLSAESSEGEDGPISDRFSFHPVAAPGFSIADRVILKVKIKHEDSAYRADSNIGVKKRSSGMQQDSASDRNFLHSNGAEETSEVDTLAVNNNGKRVGAKSDTNSKIRTKKPRADGGASSTTAEPYQTPAILNREEGEATMLGRIGLHYEAEDSVTEEKTETIHFYQPKPERTRRT